ncbi:ABC-2 transporter permease [Lysinibacillus sp. NPDC093688]|uniref:ABC-2 transporter permease n=1 Tax=Lysinibacillus sp. NPDC093688 TaxID=3390577 RepID=UPI003D034B41
MLNLIRRDVILQKKYLVVFIPFILVFVIFDTSPVLVFLVASIYIPFNTCAYDEKAETNILLNSLPYTRKEIISSRYIGAIVYMFLTIVVTSLTLFVFNKPFTITDIVISSGLFLLFVAFTFPLFQIFKSNYLTLVVLIGFIILTKVTEPIVPFISDFIVNIPLQILYMSALITIITIYAISWGITTAIYQRKIF